MNRERLEDLGRLYEQLKAITELEVWEYLSGSSYKHCNWAERFKDEEQMRRLYAGLYEVQGLIYDALAVAQADDFLNTP